jgi:hypothetical protein
MKADNKCSGISNTYLIHALERLYTRCDSDLVLVVAGGVGDTPAVSSTVEMLDLDASAGRSPQELMYLYLLTFFRFKSPYYPAKT